MFPDSWDCRKVPMSKSRGHMTSMMTMAHLKLAEQAPEVSFVQNYPGAVSTNLLRGDEGIMMLLVAPIFPILTWLRVLPPVSRKECGERQAYYCTSSMYRARDGGGEQGIKLVDGVAVATGVDGKVGSGVYSVSWDGEGGKQKTEKWIGEFVEAGLVEKLWEYTVGLFVTVTGRKEI